MQTMGSIANAIEARDFSGQTESAMSLARVGEEVENRDNQLTTWPPRSSSPKVKLKCERKR